MPQRTAVIDACCVLNLLATRREVEVVRATGLTLVMSELAFKEALFLWTPPDEEGARTKAPASTVRLREMALLSIRRLDSDALIDAFIACAASLRDADASCVALAGVLAVPLITDDGKERRVARDVFPEIEIVSTLDVLHEAVDGMKLTDAELLQLVRDLRWRGDFAPPRKDPRRGWLAGLLRRAGIRET